MPAKSHLSEVEKQILAELSKLDAFTRKDFFDATAKHGLSYWSARELLRKLLYEGKITRIGFNQYRVAGGEGNEN